MTKIQAYTGEYIEDTLEELLSKIYIGITSKYSDAQVILFGSFARGEQTKDSDIDICVVVPKITTRRLDMIVDMRTIISKVNKMFPVDLVLNTFEEFEACENNQTRMQYAVKNEGIILYDRAKIAAGDEFSRVV